jgi:hypothetical protein
MHACLYSEVKRVLFFIFYFLRHSCLGRRVIFYCVAVLVFLSRACRNTITGLCTVCGHSVIKAPSVHNITNILPETWTHRFPELFCLMRATAPAAILNLTSPTEIRQGVL